jgi:hypothetical protein
MQWAVADIDVSHDVWGNGIVALGYQGPVTISSHPTLANHVIGRVVGTLRQSLLSNVQPN